MIRDGFVDSSSVCALSDWAHRVYSNMLVRCDDAGRMDGRLEILRPLLFPLGTKRRDGEFRSAIDELAAPKDANGKALPRLLIKYEHAGRPYLQIAKFQRASNSKFSRLPFADGTFQIQFVVRETRDGMKQFVSTSLDDGIGMGSAWDTDGMGMGSVSHADGISGLYTETETKTDTETNTCGKPQVDEKASPSKARERNPLWDALAVGYFGGKVAPPDESRVGKLVRDLKALGADPSEIPARRRKIRQRWKESADTPESLVKHWAELGPQIQPLATASMDAEEAARAERRAREQAEQAALTARLARLDELDHDTLEALKAKAVSAAPNDFTRKNFAAADPRTNRPLRIAMLTHIEEPANA